MGGDTIFIETDKLYALYVDENIKSKAMQFKRDGYKNFERVKVCDVTPRINQAIKRLIGFDAMGYEVYSNTNTFKHIESGHGENGKPDVTYAFCDMRGRPSKMIKFSKVINDIKHVVVAVPENKYKKLWVISEYIEQKKILLSRVMTLLSCLLRP